MNSNMHKISASSHIFALKRHFVIWMEAKSEQKSRMCSEGNTQNGRQNCANDGGHAAPSPEGELILRKPLSLHTLSPPP